MPISFFLDETKLTMIRFPKNIAISIFSNEAPKAALSNYIIQ